MIARRLARIARAKWIAGRTQWRVGPAEPDADRVFEADFEPAPPSAPPANPAKQRAREILEISADATSAELKTSYRALCRRYHPDRFAGDPERFEQANELLREVTWAYRVLTEPASPGG